LTPRLSPFANCEKASLFGLFWHIIRYSRIKNKLFYANEVALPGAWEHNAHITAHLDHYAHAQYQREKEP
jgi:hypothetical protein